VVTDEWGKMSPPMDESRNLRKGLFPLPLPSLPLKVGPIKPDKESGERCKLP